MTRQLNHHRLDLPKIPEFNRLNREDIEIWDDDPDGGDPAHVTLYTSEWNIDLTPNEARALAALLVNAADHQDRRTRPSNPVSA